MEKTRKTELLIQYCSATVYTLIIILKHLSIFPSVEEFSPLKSWNSCVRLEKQTEMIVCGCIGLLV